MSIYGEGLEIGLFPCFCGSNKFGVRGWIPGRVVGEQHSANGPDDGLGPGVCHGDNFRVWPGIAGSRTFEIAEFVARSLSRQLNPGRVSRIWK